MLVLKTRAEFQAVARQGRRWHAPAFIIQAMKKDGAPLRVGFTASRKVGGAVQRNRAKRRLREAARTHTAGLSGADIVLIAKTAATDHDFSALCADLQRGLKALGVAA